jgi:uncharacterized protein (DUF4213/DUF364 family)
VEKGKIMNVLKTTRNKFIELCDKHSDDMDCQISVRPLSAQDAVGDKLTGDFSIKRGKEQVIEAVFNETAGQAFTDTPSSWSGTLRKMLKLDLSASRDRAVFVAGMNAVLSHWGLASGVNHCKDDDPFNCGWEITKKLVQRFGREKTGLVGLQPAILNNPSECFEPHNVRVLDLDPDNIGKRKCGVEVWNGETELFRLVNWCDVELATGSSIVNGTIDEIIENFKDGNKPLIFFGNTIVGTAALVNLERLCPFGR